MRWLRYGVLFALLVAFCVAGEHGVFRALTKPELRASGADEDDGSARATDHCRVCCSQPGQAEQCSCGCGQDRDRGSDATTRVSLPEKCQCGCDKDLEKCDADECEYKHAVEAEEALEVDLVEVTKEEGGGLGLPSYKYSNERGSYFLDGKTGIADGSSTRKMKFDNFLKSKDGKFTYYVYKIDDVKIWFAFSAEPFKVNGGRRYYLYRRDGTDGPWKRITTHGGTSRRAIQ